MSSKTASSQPTHTNFLYNISYNWFSIASGWFGAIAFKSQISRRNYRYINPFQSLNTDVTSFAGDIGIGPSKNYSLLYNTGTQKYVFYSYLILMEDFISSVMELSDDNLLETYRNFNKVYIGGGGIQHNEAFFNSYWTTKNVLGISYAKLDDTDFNKNLKESTPIFNFNTINNIKVGKLFRLGINYELYPTFHDGIYKHFLRHQLDLTLSKKINAFKISLFAKDLLKTNYESNKISLSNFSYHSNYYYDVMSFGLTVNWILTGDD